MSLVRVAVPVLHGRCKFFFEKGRPWSVIEHVLLESLARKAYTISDLAETGRLPRRLAIEAVIRLMRAGWVEMVEKGSSVTFRATDNGAVAATRDELPNAPRQLSRSMNFVVDQITGTVYRSRELPFLHQHMVEEMAEKEKIVWVERPEVERRDEVGQLLEVLFADDEKFISVDFDGGRLAERWSLVSVRDGKSSELTSRAPSELVECVETAASGIAVQEESGERNVYRLPKAYDNAELHTLPVRKVNLLARDLIFGGKEQEQVLHSVLSRSRHRVVIHSTFISLARFNALLPFMRDALHRGVRVDVLWGQDESMGDHTTREVVTGIRAMVSSEQLESLHVHPFSTGSHSKILLADDGEPDRMNAFVGSCNWLSSPFQSFEATVRLRDPWIVADVVDQVAELSKGDRGHWSPLTKELAAMSAGLRMASSPASRSQTSAQVVLASTHADMVRCARDESARRIFVTSHRWGTAARSIVLAPALAAAESKGVRVEAYYGTVSGPVGPDGVGVERPGGTGPVTIRAVRKPRLHAKMLAWDEDSVVITSQNWLSSDPPDSAPRQELGVFLNGPGLADSVVERFQAAIQVDSGGSALPADDVGS